MEKSNENGKIVLKGALQKAEQHNGGRLYPADAINEAIRKLKEKRSLRPIEEIIEHQERLYEMFKNDHPDMSNFIVTALSTIIQLRTKKILKDYCS